MRRNTEHRQSWLGGLFRRKQKQPQQQQQPQQEQEQQQPQPACLAAAGKAPIALADSSAAAGGAQVQQQQRKYAPSPFALRQPKNSALLKKRRQQRGSSWPLSAPSSSSSSSESAASASGGAGAGAAGSAQAGAGATINEDTAVMGGGSAPSSPSLPGMTLMPMLGNPKTSSLHKRRELRRSQKRFVAKPGPGGVQERDPAQPQPWSPRTCMHLNVDAPPDSPLWGFDTPILGAAPAALPAVLPLTLGSATSPAASGPALSAVTASTTDNISSSSPFSTAFPSATAGLFEMNSTATPTTQGSQPTAESSSWSGTVFGFGPDVDKWASCSPRPSSHKSASFC